MSEEKNIAKLAELFADAEGLVQKYNDLLQNGKIADANKVDTELADKIGEYTATVRSMAFDKCLESENPMLAAVKMLSFKSIAVKDEVPEGATLPVRKLVDVDRRIDLLKLDKYATSKKGKGIGADSKWVHIVQKFNFCMTAQKCKDLGIDPKQVNDSYSMSEIARQFDMGKNPTSNTQLLKTMRTVVAAMLGEEFAKGVNSHDVNFLTSIYAKKTRKALTVSCANHKNFCGYIAEVCHRIATGATYGCEYKVKRDKATPLDATAPVPDAPKTDTAPKPDATKKADKPAA